jgi:predicted AlkP superfamily phosphohydrolase/phosphomutase
MVVGLDGVPFTLVERFCADGTWKFMDSLKKSGALKQMEVTLPELSAVSWPSFMTGKNPGDHGIYGFTEFKENSYEIHYTNFKDLKVPTVWERLGEKGKQSIVLNQPGTYPARPIPGILVSGFVAVEMAKAVQPLRYLAALRKMNYQIDIDMHKCRKDFDLLFKELDKTLDLRKKAVEFFWDEIDWDFFEVVKTGTDRLQHYLFNAVEDTSHPRFPAALAYYKKIEEFIRHCWQLFFKGQSGDQEGEGFFMLSDHGFCRTKTEVYVNAWLKKNHYLEFEVEPAEEISQMKKTSKAFALDPSRIYLHRQGRFPQGFLNDAQAEELRSELKAKLLSLEFEGEKVLKAVYRPEEIYSGPELKTAPDLVLLSNHGYDLKGSPSKSEIFGNSDLTGMHTYDDAFFWARECAMEKVKITDLAQIFMDKLA